MTPELIRYYQQELDYLQERGAEFADAYPDVAQSLGLSKRTHADLAVEQLLQGVAFLTARQQMNADANYPKLAQHCIEQAYPHLVLSIPSISVAQLTPEEDCDGAGVTVERETPLYTDRLPGSTECQYSTCKSVSLWPIEITDFRYQTSAHAQYPAGTAATIQLTLRTVSGQAWSDLEIDELDLYSSLSPAVFDALIAQWSFLERCGLNPSLVVQDDKLLPVALNMTLGPTEDENILLGSNPTFSGYRLLQEYFACPQAFSFIRLKGLKKRLRVVKGDTLTLIWPLPERDDRLEWLSAERLHLFCTPIVNLFRPPYETERTRLKAHAIEHEIQINRRQSDDYEIYHIESVSAFRPGSVEPTYFYPFTNVTGAQSGRYFHIHRTRALPSSSRSRKHHGAYLGMQTSVSLVDSVNPNDASAFDRLSASVWCTNRDLPELIAQQGRLTLSMSQSAPVKQVAMLFAPSQPHYPLAESNQQLALLAHLHPQFLGFSQSSKSNADQLRQLLSFYPKLQGGKSKTLMNALIHLGARPMNRLDHRTFPTTLFRGLEWAMSVNPELAPGWSLVLFSKILSMVLSRFLTVNAYAQLTLENANRDAVYPLLAHWSMQSGKQPLN